MNYFNYFTEIEEEFVRRRGSHMLVSPLDWSLMESWKQRDIPLQVVLRGIGNSFDGYDQRAHRGRKVNSLFYCQQEVEALFQEFIESRVGSSEPAVNENGNEANGSEPSQFTKNTINDYLTDHLEMLTQLCARHAGVASLRETFERVILRLEQIIEDAQTAKAISPENLEADLTMIEEVVLDGLKESVSEEQLKEIEQEGNQKLRAYKKSMGQEVYEQTLGNFVAQRLREQFGVPRLSLFYL
ncbi:MAG: hypothetical protein SF097_25945 [Acidobacteriota bacterium]|nr:hypothetical protein [Acidobacteriota bacterium]